MKKRHALFLGIQLFIFSGCAELNNILQTVPGAVPLSESEISEGLKEALITGSKNASSILSAEDGYYGDQLVRIMLPEEALVITENISKIPGGEELLEDVILSINRAAEDAAREVAPIFINSIKQMSISDAMGILHGADNAATQYLSNTSRNDLYKLFKPKISKSSSKDIVAGISARDSWDVLTGKWNRLATSVPGKIAGFTPVETDLDDYLTNKALDGMFLKVETEELKIRQEVSARVTPLLKKVFGSLEN